MTDDQTQDPLAALEDAIKDTQQKTAKPVEGSDQATGPTPAAEAAAQQELQQMTKAQREKDAAALKQQLADFQQTAANSPQEQARQQQAQEQAQNKAARTASQDGYEIQQLEHTKISQN